MRAIPHNSRTVEQNFAKLRAMKLRFETLMPLLYWTVTWNCVYNPIEIYFIEFSRVNNRPNSVAKNFAKLYATIRLRHFNAWTLDFPYNCKQGSPELLCKLHVLSHQKIYNFELGQIQEWKWTPSIYADFLKIES